MLIRHLVIVKNILSEVDSELTSDFLTKNRLSIFKLFYIRCAEKLYD